MGSIDQIKIVRISSPAFRLLRSEATGSLHSVFEQSFNIIWGERLIHMQWERELNSPFSLQLNGITMGEFQKTLKRGDPILKEDTGLRIGDRRAIQYSPKDLEFYHPSIDPVAEFRASKLRKISVILENEMKHLVKTLLSFGYLAEVRNRCTIETDKLSKNLEKPGISHSLLEGFIEKLIGLGPGLTPFGDDFLVGIFCAIAPFRSDSGIIQRVFKRLGAALLIHLGRTCLISREFLSYAVKGCFSERLTNLMRLILRYEWDEEELKDRIRHALKCGVTSGIGTLMGIGDGFRIVFALKRLEGKQNG